MPEDIVSQTQIIYGSGYSTALSKARSLLVSSELPVTLILDSKTTDTTTIKERKGLILQSVRQLSGPDRFQTFLAVPEIEAIFF